MKEKKKVLNPKKLEETRLADELIAEELRQINIKYNLSGFVFCYTDSYGHFQGSISTQTGRINVDELSQTLANSARVFQFVKETHRKFIEDISIGKKG